MVWIELFATTAVVGFGLFFLLSLTLALLVKLMGFSRPAAPKITLAYLLRCLLASVFAGLTAMYILWRQPAYTQEAAWMSLVTALIVWTVLLLVWDLIGVPLRDM